MTQIGDTTPPDPSRKFATVGEALDDLAERSRFDPDDLAAVAPDPPAAPEPAELERPGWLDQDVDAAIWSTTSIGGKRLTWREHADYLTDRLRTAEGLAGVLADLDRCEHGRHEGDVCSSCGGPSHGNPLIPPGGSIGFDLSARPIKPPARELRGDPEAWRA